MDSFFNNDNLIRIFAKWKWHLSVILLLAVIASLVISSPLFIKSKYRSTAILYPANVTPYSKESETEQMLQWLNSSFITEKIIEQFNLASRYEINKDHKHYHSLITKLYNKNVRIKRTPYEAIQIDVMDFDPVIACQMVDSVISFTNQVILEKHKEKYHEVLLIQENKLKQKKEEIDSVAGKLRFLRTEFGIYDYPNQTREVTRGYLRTVDGDNSRNINTPEVIRLQESIKEKGGEWIMFSSRYNDLIKEYGLYKLEYEAALTNANKEITFVTIVTKPVPADKKSYPKRSLILLYTVISSLFLSIVIISIIEGKKGHIIPGASGTHTTIE